MSFRKRLARVGKPSARVPAERVGAPVLGGSERHPAAGEQERPTTGTPGATNVCVAGGADKGAILGELRSRMDAILGKPPDSTRETCNPSATLLPFVEYETPAGIVHRRRELLPRSFCVGRIPVDAARHADSALLALLGLEPTLAPQSTYGALYLDCETTGLGGAGTLPFLVGMAWFEAEQLVLEQLLLRSPAEEPGLLALVAERAQTASILVTFNGKTFDWPLLAARCVMNRAPPLPPLPHLDLLHVGRRLHRPRLKSCRLVDLESDVLGFVRGPDIAGAEVAARYGHFLRSGDEDVLRQVVDHNAFDVVTMAALVGLYGEPLAGLHQQDLLSLARTFQRSKAWDHAEDAAAESRAQGGGSEALRVQAQLAKARGERSRALTRFEELADQVDDPKARLELAKLYEHYVKDPATALAIARQGTGEDEVSRSRREARLEQKLRRVASGKRAPRSDR